jgi:hypothetical protein
MPYMNGLTYIKKQEISDKVKVRFLTGGQINLGKAVPLPDANRFKKTKRGSR